MKGIPASLPVCRVEPQIIEKRVGGIIEGQDVVGHVHVTVVIDPLGVDLVAMELERGGDHLGPPICGRKPLE
jgi:hypothetical protein